MLQTARVTIILLALVPLSIVSAADPGRDFSGKWLLNPDHSDMRGLTGEIYPAIVIEHRSAIHCAATTAAGKSVEWTYRLDGGDSKYKIGEDSMNSAVKWEGSALLINTLVNGSHSYTVMDRWTLSRDGTQLNIQRQIVRGQMQDEGYLIYRREGSLGAPATSTGTAVTELQPAAGTTLVRRPEAPAPPPPTQFTIAQGTHILLSLTNPVSTKNSKDGDPIYLTTAIPIAQEGRIVIPRGSYVRASVARARPRAAAPAKARSIFVSIP